MGIVHLIRHAAPLQTGILLGSTDIELAPIAITPASIAVETVYASPLRRAHNSATHLFPGQTAIIHPDLAERHLGDWESRTWAEVEQLWPELAAAATLDWFATTPPHGEPWPDFVQRVHLAWSTIRQAEAPVAIVAHAGVNAVLAHAIAGVPPLAFAQAYLEIKSFDF